MALKAKPNPAHYALATLAKKMGDGFQTLSQNVDGKWAPVASCGHLLNCTA